VRAFIAAGLTAISSSDASAGAFTLEKGETKLFVLGLASSGNGYYDRDGKRRSRETYSKKELQLFIEYGVRDWLTLFSSTGLQKIRLAAHEDFVRKGQGRSEIGARVRLWNEGAWTVSAQALGVLAGARETDGIAAFGETDHQVDGRLLVARSFAFWGMPSFVDVAAGYRFRTGYAADEVRVDATFGVRPFDRLLALAQSFNQIGVARWEGPLPLKQRIHKLQAAALFDLTPGLQLIGAAFVSPIGRDALDERGATLGIGLRF